MTGGPAGHELPTGTVTFLFTDIEGSTRLLQSLGDRWKPTLEDHNRLVREAIRGAGGLDIRTEGDAFFAVFRSAPAAAAAAATAQRALAAHPWPSEAPVRVRMGMHTGEGALGGDEYVGLDVHRAARIAAAGHGGQVLVSATTSELVRDELPDGVGLRDLGPHRLKDLARPERIHQLAIADLPNEFPPLSTLETPTNLPAERTSFVGRRREVERVEEMLRGAGLLTLTGPGGSGKTRLALRAAAELLDHYRDGVFFVELGPIRDPELVPSAIAEAVGARAEGWRPVLDTLREHVREREMLLILDNFEQVLDAAPVVSELLEASSRMRVLVTSRERLHLKGEQELAVPPLNLPDADDDLDRLSSCESVALFIQRATAVDPSFEVTEENARAVAELSIRLEGLPLAIELAASRIKVLSPQAILERLGDRLDLLVGGPVDVPARQRTLREAIGWSHELLEEPERVVFRRLSVFAGGWTLSAAEEVANPDGELGSDILEILGSLVDKSLVSVSGFSSGETRFGFLETIREFGADALEDSGEADQTRARHASYYLGIAEAAAPHLREHDQKRRLDELEAEHDNIRGGLRWAIDNEQGSLALRLVGALWRFWHFHGHLAEGRRWAEGVLAMPGASARTIERSRALTSLGGVTYWQEDFSATRKAYEEALEIAREVGDRHAEAEGLYNMGYPPAYEGNFPEAIESIRQSRALYEELGVTRGLADCLWLLAIVARLEGDYPTARELAERSLRLHRQEGDRFGVTDALHVLGRIAIADGDVATARASFLEALGYDEEVENRTGMGIVLDNLATLASLQGDHIRAVRLSGASEAIKDAAGGHAPPPFIDLPDPREAARETTGEAAVRAAWEEGQAMTLEQALALAREVGG
jgi:predicted ATPase/class 3 adenylate cyclase